MGYIADQLEKPELYKHSTNLLSIIIKKADLENQILDVEDNIISGEFEIYPNDYIDELENTLQIKGVTSKFAILLSDLIIKNQGFKQNNID